VAMAGQAPRAGGQWSGSFSAIHKNLSSLSFICMFWIFFESIVGEFTSLTLAMIRGRTWARAYSRKGGFVAFGCAQVSPARALGEACDI